MLRSIDGLAVRQLRTRPMRAALTGLRGRARRRHGVRRPAARRDDPAHVRRPDQLGVGQDGPRSSAARPTACCPSRAQRRCARCRGVRDAAPWAGGMFTRLDGRGRAVEGPAGRSPSPATRPTRTPPFDFRLGRGPAAGRGRARSRSSATGPARAASKPATRLRVATPTGPAELDVVGVFRFSSGLSFGGRGFAAMPLEALRPLIDLPKGFLQISVVLEDKGALESRAEAAAAQRSATERP